MKKYRSIFIISVLVLFASCGKENTDIQFYTVTFETEGGNPVPPVQRVEQGSTASAPSTNPVKTGYVFVHWHLSGANNGYNFQTPVSSDITLYAKWQNKAIAEYWQVTWELNGGSWSPDDNHATEVLKNGTLSEPNVPIKTGFTFDGWYKESALINKVIFPYDVKDITGNFILYAKWQSASTESNTFTIRTTTDWNNAVSKIRSGGANKSYILDIQGTVSIPPTTGVDQEKPDTYTFGGAENITVTLKGSGTLSLSGKGFLLCMKKQSGIKQKLIIDGPVLQGRSDNVVSLLRLELADLELKNGKITGNTNNGSGGAGNGGGVYIQQGTLTMSGGEISNNICGQSNNEAYGGGVALKSSTFNMSGGIISGNTANLGGGVYMNEYSFNMTGGEIKGNTAKASSPRGGALYVNYGSFNKTGGIIYGSDADESIQNKVIDYNNNVHHNRGAVAFYSPNNIVGDWDDKRREKTLGEKDNISTEKDTGWGL